MKTPDGYRTVRLGASTVLVLPEAEAWVRSALQEHRTLHDAAARAGGAAAHHGRGPVHVIGAGGKRWAVRHYHRGGAVAGPLLGDRYLRVGEPRPFRELRASEMARERGVPTPRVVAAAVYPRGVFYRGDLLTRYVPDSTALANALFGEAGEADESDQAGEPRESDESGEPAEPAERAERAEAAGKAEAGPGFRRRALEEAGRLLGRMAAAGVRHPDLNAANILLTTEGTDVRAMLLDLDRCRVTRPARPVSPERMLARLERSLRKRGTPGGDELKGEDWTSLRNAVRAPGEAAGPDPAPGDGPVAPSDGGGPGRGGGGAP